MGKIRFRPDMFRMENLLQTTGGLVLADEDMAMLPLVNIPLEFQPFEFKMMKEAGLSGMKNPLSNPSNGKNTRLILLYDPPYWDSRAARWTPAMLEAIEENYQREPRISQKQPLYRPGNSAPVCHPCIIERMTSASQNTVI
jgi:hypothetical protein